MDYLTDKMEELLAAKQARRHKLAMLSLPDKVQVVIRLQNMAVPLLRARGREVSAWKIDKPAKS